MPANPWDWRAERLGARQRVQLAPHRSHPSDPAPTAGPPANRWPEVAAPARAWRVTFGYLGINSSV